jgi:hypothetical protein
MKNHIISNTGERPSGLGSKTHRKAYILAFDESSDRVKHSSDLLKKIGFEVILVNTIEHDDAVISNKLGMQTIFEMISNSTDETWSYVFEDDIDILEPITLEQIVKYEEISKMFFYLGCCKFCGEKGLKKTKYKIDDFPVYSVSGHVACLHAVAYSKHGASELLEFSLNENKERYMDVILRRFSYKYPPNVMRYDLSSPQHESHRGIFFQDRKRYSSNIQ